MTIDIKNCNRHYILVSFQEVEAKEWRYRPPILYAAWKEILLKKMKEIRDAQIMNNIGIFLSQKILVFELNVNYLFFNIFHFIYLV